MRTSSNNSTATTNNNTTVTTTATTNPVITNTTQYVQVTPTQMPIEHINLEYLSGVNVSEDAQCLLDISNNTTNVISNHHTHQVQQQHQQPQEQSQQHQSHQTQQQTHHQQPQQHQSLAAQHIQQFKIEYQPDNEYGEESEEVIVQQCAVEVETVPATEENNAINNYETHNITATNATLPHQTQHIRTLTNNTKKVYHQIINSNGLITTQPAIKRQRLDVSSNEQDITDALTAAVEYFKHQTAIADADAAFAKYILEELRQMSKKRKNEFKRMVATWLTTQDDETAGE